MTLCICGKDVRIVRSRKMLGRKYMYVVTVQYINTYKYLCVGMLEARELQLASS